MKNKLPVVLILLLLLAGCSITGDQSELSGRSVSPTPETAEIRLLAYNSQSIRTTYLEYLRRMLPDISVTYEYVSMDYYGSNLNTQLLSENGPDIIEVGGETRLLAVSGKLLDLTGQSFVDQYLAASLTPYSVNSHIYATPLQSWFEGIFYNKRIFEENGLSPPATLDEFIELHKQLAADGIKPQTMGAQSWEPLMKQSIGMVANEFFSKKENAGFDLEFDAGRAYLKDNWLPAVTEWSRLITEGCLTPDMLNYSYEQALDEFAGEQAAMWESGPWSVGTILQKNPDIQLGMFPIPGTEEGTGWLVGGPGSALAVNKNSRNIEAALRVLEVTATPEAQAALLSDSEGMSSVLDVDADLGPIYSDCEEALEAGHIYAPWITTWTYGNPIVETYGKALQDVLAGQKTVEDALWEADAVNRRMHGLAE